MLMVGIPTVESSRPAPPCVFEQLNHLNYYGFRLMLVLSRYICSTFNVLRIHLD